MIITALVVGAIAVVGTVGADHVINKKYDKGEIDKTNEDTLQQFDETAFSEEEKANFQENAEMSVSDYQKIIAQMQEEIKAKKSEFNASQKGKGLIGSIGDGIKSIFGGGSKKVKNGIEDAEEKLNELISKGDNVTLAEIQEVYKAVMGADLDLDAIKATMNSIDGVYTVQQADAQGNVSQVSYSKEDIVAKVQENAKRLQAKFDKTKSDQGIISKGLGLANNLLGIGTTGNEAQAQITAYIELAGSLSASDDDATFAAKFKAITGKELTEQSIAELMFDVDAFLAEYEKNSSVPLTELEKEQIKDYYTMMGDSPANEAIMDYESTQESIKQGFNMIVTTAVVIAAVAASPFTGGASLSVGAIALGAAVGAGTNVALNAADGLTSADGYSLDEAAMDALKGAATGALAGAGGGLAKGTGQFVASKVSSQVAQRAITGAVVGATYGATSSAANYTIDTAVKNNIVEGELVQNLKQEYVDEQGRTCVQYPVIDKNGDILYYETHVYDVDGTYLEKFTSNDFSIGGLASATASGAATGAVTGAVAGGAGFKFGQTDGTTAQRLVQGTKLGAVGGATGGAASGVSNWAQSGFEGGASGLVDNVVDGTLEGTVTGAAAGFAVAGGQIAGEKLAPKTLSHIENKYEKAQQDKLAADKKAEAKAAKAADSADDGADETKTRAQKRADKQVDKAAKKVDKALVKGMNADAKAEAKAAKAGEADIDGDDVAKTRAQQRADKQLDKSLENYKNAKAKQVEADANAGKTREQIRAEKRVARYEKYYEAQSENVRNYGYAEEADAVASKKAEFDSKLEKGEVEPSKSKMETAKDIAAKSREKSADIRKKIGGLKPETGEKKTITERLKSTYDSAKENWNTVKSEKGLFNKGKAILGIGRDAVTGRVSKWVSRFTKTDATTVADTSKTPAGTAASTPSKVSAVDNLLDDISFRNKGFADRLASANLPESTLKEIAKIVRTSSGGIDNITIDRTTGSVGFELNGRSYDVSGGTVYVNGIDTSIAGIWKDYDGSFDT